MNTIKCPICGSDFYPLKGDHYISSNPEGDLFDTFDCPKCSSQVIVNQRQPLATKLTDGPIPSEEDDSPFETREDALRVLNAMIDRVFFNGHITLKEVRDVLGDTKSTDRDSSLGWISLNEARIEPKGNRFVIVLPRPIDLF